MAGNKSAIARYRIMDRCFRDKSGKWTKRELVRKCAAGTGTQVSEHAIIKDIEHMRHDTGLGFFAPIVYSYARGYHYSQSDFRLNLDPIKAEHIEFLREALQILENVLDDLQIKQLHMELYDLAQKHNISYAELSAKTIGIEESPFGPAVQWIDTLRRHIRLKEAITITYKPFDMPAAYPKVVSPLYLKRYNQRWFLFAEAHDEHKIRVFGLDRILNITASLRPFRDKDFDPKKYFADIVGVSIPDKARKVNITFEATPLRAEYILSKPFHNSLKEVSRTHKKVMFALEAIPNFELESIFLSFCEDVKVVSPSTLRRRLQRRLKKAVGNYG